MNSEITTLYRINDDKTELIEQYPKTISDVVYDTENEQFLSDTISEFNQHLEQNNQSAHTIDNIEGLRDALNNSGGMSETTTPITYYVDGTNGDDSNNGLTSGTAFKTIQKAIDKIPKLVLHSVNVNIALGQYDEVIILEGFYCTSVLNLNGFDVNNTIVKGIVFADCAGAINIKKISVNFPKFNSSVYIRGCFGLTLENYKDSSVSSAGFSIYGSSLQLKNVEISNKSTSAISVSNNSSVLCLDVSGVSNAVGLNVSSLSRVLKTNFTMSATILERVTEGGQILS